MSRRHVIFSSLALVGALALSGCTAGSQPAPSAVPTAEGPTADVQACTDFSDVLTIVANADAGLRDGRMAAQEQQGWNRLAARALDRIDGGKDTEVGSAIATLKNVAPAVETGAVQTNDIGSQEWYVGVDDLSTACTGVDVELAVNMFTGG